MSNIRPNIPCPWCPSLSTQIPYFPVPIYTWDAIYLCKIILPSQHNIKIDRIQLLKLTDQWNIPSTIFPIQLSSRGFHFCHGVCTFAKKYRVSSRGIHSPGYHGTKPCFPLTPPEVKFSIHIYFLRKNTSSFFPKMPEKPGKSKFFNEKSHGFHMFLFYNYCSTTAANL